MPISFSGRGCPVQSHKSSRSSSQQQQHDHLMEQSPTARREMQLLEDHRPWEMLDNMVLAIIDQTYTALLRMHGRAPDEDGAGGRVVASQRADASDPESPLLCVEASARHCCVHVPHHSRGGGGEEFAGRAAACRFPTFPNTKAGGWPPRHRLTRTRVHATIGTLYMARVDGGARGDYWSCADDDVVGTGLRGVVDAIRARLDAAVRVEARMLEMVRAHRCRRGPKAVGIFRVWTALGQMKREVSLDVIVRRARFQKRRRVELVVTACPPPPAAAAEMGDAEADALANSFNALQVDEDEAEVLTKRLKAMQV